MMICWLFQKKVYSMLFAGLWRDYVRVPHDQSKKLREVNIRLLRIRILQVIQTLSMDSEHNSGHILICFPIHARFTHQFVDATWSIYHLYSEKYNISVWIDAYSVAPHLSSLCTLGTFFNPFLGYTLTPGYRKRCGGQIRRVRLAHPHQLTQCYFQSFEIKF